MSDQLQDVLDKSNAPREVKAQAWDAFQSKDEKSFKAAMDKVLIPKETKAVLWDLKFGSKVAAQPSITSEKGVKSAFYTGVQKLKDFNTAQKSFVKKSLPTLGGVVGGVIGGAAGGPAGAIGGATLGGAAGESLKQLGEDYEGTGPKSSLEAAKRIAGEGAIQGALELSGMGIAKFAKMLAPISRSQYLAYGAKAGELEKGIERLVPDFDRTIAQSSIPKPKGEMAIGDFEKIVGETNHRLQGEYGQALGPIANQTVMPSTVARDIRASIKPNMLKTADGRKIAAELERRAREFDRPWKIGELDLERETISKRLNPLYKSSPSSANAKLKLDAEEIADKAANDALKDVLYTRADQTAGKPAGYFRDLKQKQSILTSLGDSVKKAKTSLEKAAAEGKGAPLREKVHVRLYQHPSGRIGGVGGIPLEVKGSGLKMANKQIERGFPSTTRKGLTKLQSGISKTFSNRDVNALPLRMLLQEARQKSLSPLNANTNDSEQQ